MAKKIAGLGRRAQFLLVGAVCVCGALVAYVLAGSGSNTFPSLGEVLFAQPVPVTERLYSGATDPKTGAPVTPYAKGTELMGANGIPIVHYLSYKDGSLEVIQLQEDGVLPRESKLYYPNLESPLFLQLHKRSVYAADGKDIVEQTIYRTDGSRQQHTTMKIEARGMPLGIKIHFLTKKWKMVQSFAADGKTLVGNEDWFKDEFTDLVLVNAKRWLDNPAHSLVYKEVFSDKIRKMTELDARGMVMKHTEVNEYRHATVKGYHPGGMALRLEGKSDYYENKVDFFRTDGTREFAYDIGPGSFEIIHFDVNGKKLWKQMWSHATEGFTTDKPEMLNGLNWIHEYDDAGEESRVIWVYNGKVKDDTRKNYTVDGIRYVSVEWNYDDNGYLKNVEYYRDARNQPATKVVNHTPEEKILPAVDPAYFAKPTQLEPGMIIPVQQHGHM